MGDYDVAQICLNCHVINSSSISFPRFNKKFCNRCGSPTITECPSCKTSIRGRYKDSLGVSAFPAPSYCDNCGKPYPWISSAIEAARELTKELDSLDKEEKETLTKSIDEIVIETPKTKLEALKFKKLMLKVGKEAAELFKSTLASIVSETAKKIIWGQ